MVEEIKKIFVSKPVTQLILKHLSAYAVLNDGRGYSHLSSAIALLQGAIGEIRIKDHYKDDYENIINISKDFGKRASYINHYFDFLKDKDYRDSSVFNKAYRDYFNSLQHIPLIHHKVIEFFYYLLSQTELETTSIPSSYIAQSSRDVINFDKEDEDKNLFNKSKLKREHEERELENANEG